MQYREAHPSDVPAIVVMRADWGGDAERQGGRMARYLAGEHHPRHALRPRVMFVACDGHSIAGYIAGHLTRRFGCDGELEWIHVAPAYRGTGVAAELLRRLVAWFGARGAARVCVDVTPDNAAARRFYARHGAHPLQPSWMVWDDIAAVPTIPPGRSPS
jgi:ribosomal protein S18 acetylase RimI-like enzyme